MERIAVIDLGSNSARLVIANVLPNGHFVIIDELKESVRLGQDMERDGFLKPSRVAQAVKTLKMFRKLCDSYCVDKVYAIATNAVRRAKNQKSFLEEINSVCGFKFKVLTEEEEAVHIYQGVINSLDVPKAVIVDISGSSTQLIHYNRRNIINRENLPFGTITLSDLFNDPNVSPEKQSQMIETYVLDQFSQIAWLKELDPDVQFVGVGGSFRNLAKICKRRKRYPLEMIHNYNVSLADFNAIYDMVKVLDADKRTKIKGLSVERADIFSSALACIKGFFDFTGFENLVISGCGIREGIMFNHAVPSTVEKPITDVLGHSIYTMMHYFDVNIPHAEHVCNLSIQLYKQLRVLHKLPRQYVKVLRVAALLHDAGMRIKYYDHPKHSFYFILNSNLCGISHRELTLAAFVAQGHRMEEFPINEWNKYKDILREEDLVAVAKLSVILRIAESLDRAMSGSVKMLNCDVLGDSVIMKTEVEGDCSLEIKDALTAGAEFARAYKKNLEIL
ncbi:MAG: Ppx/GppA family phosphatase [Clostridiales bacterium]|nr:Ppx/GppA family phosphatase [Clostridiales bacterium]